MAREKRRKDVGKTARCGNGHKFPVKQEYVSHRVGVPGGYEYTEWKPGKVEGIVECPVPGCRSTSFELVDQ
jgi:hypothetical protein